MSNTNFKIEPGKQEVVVTRTFDAPRDLVFRIYTDPNLLPQWWGPGDLTTIVDKMVVRPGGLWRFIQRDQVGNEFAFHGVYHTVQPPDQIIYTFEFEGMPGHVLLETVTFEERNGKTIVVDRSVFQTIEDRDGMVGMGMEKGSRESTDRFALLLAREVKTK